MRFSFSNNAAIPLALLLIISYFSLFHQLGKAPIQLWDESWYALNAQEMLEKGNPIEIFLLGKPDIANSKPPFAIWCMALSIQFWGFNELGARFASAFFGLLAALVLYALGRRILNHPYKALLLPLVLLSSQGFIAPHITRSGDTDSMLAFWILMQCICCHQFVKNTSTKKGHYWLVGLSLSVCFAILTKGVAGFLVLPGILAWLLYTRNLKAVFNGWGWLVALTLFIILVPGYYWLRNELTPGYFQSMLHFEIGGRLTQQEYLNPTPLPFYYYYASMVQAHRFMPWVLVLLPAVFMVIKTPNSESRSVGLLLVFSLLSASAFLAASSTKLFYYDASLYPLMSGIIGIAAGGVAANYVKPARLLFLALFCYAFYHIQVNHHAPSTPNSLKQLIVTLRDKEYRPDSIYIINSDPNYALHFYAKQDRLAGYYNEVLQHTDPKLTAGKFILTEKYPREFDVNQKFILDTIYRLNECSYY